MIEPEVKFSMSFLWFKRPGCIIIDCTLTTGQRGSIPRLTDFIKYMNCLITPKQPSIGLASNH